jgi:hypothetical protein
VPDTSRPRRTRWIDGCRCRVMPAKACLVGPLGEPAQELGGELGSSAGAVVGAVDIPTSFARWKAARRFNACAGVRVDAI